MSVQPVVRADESDNENRKTQKEQTENNVGVPKKWQYSDDNTEVIIQDVVAMSQGIREGV
ncbi:hypothetical protein N7486_002543 [Penicillium sp. IBT 16267x]|nr:hypothetical protein N7486_002543 [Penicillium sp. IBT 16267x]